VGDDLEWKQVSSFVHKGNANITVGWTKETSSPMDIRVAASGDN